MIITDEIQYLAQDCEDLISLANAMVDLAQEARSACITSREQGGWEAVQTTIGHIASQIERRRLELLGVGPPAILVIQAM